MYEFCIIRRSYSANNGATTAGKTKALPGFWKIECGETIEGSPVMWLPLWQSCLPKICRGGPEYYIESIFSKKTLQQLLLWQFSSSLVRTIKNKVHTIAKKCVNALDFPREPHLRVEAGGGRSTHGPCNPTARPCHSLVKLHHKAGGCRWNMWPQKVSST